MLRLPRGSSVTSTPTISRGRCASSNSYWNTRPLPQPASSITSPRRTYSWITSEKRSYMPRNCGAVEALAELLLAPAEAGAIAADSSGYGTATLGTVAPLARSATPPARRRPTADDRLIYFAAVTETRETGPGAATASNLCPEGLMHHDHRSRTRSACLHEGAPRSRRPLRAPDPPLGPADEAVHLHRAQRHPHHRPPADRPAARRRRWTSCAPSPSRGETVLFVGTKKQAQESIETEATRARHAVRHQPLARRHADQLPDDREPHRPPRAARRPRATAASSAC